MLKVSSINVSVRICIIGAFFRQLPTAIDWLITRDVIEYGININRHNKNVDEENENMIYNQQKYSHSDINIF